MADTVALDSTVIIVGALRSESVALAFGMPEVGDLEASIWGRSGTVLDKASGVAKSIAPRKAAASSPAVACLSPRSFAVARAITSLKNRETPEPPRATEWDEGNVFSAQLMERQA